MSIERTGHAEAAPRCDRGTNGRGLCRRCGEEVPKGRLTFCGEACIHEWKLRTDPGYLRNQVEKRDRGRCGRCGVRPQAWSDHHGIAGKLADVQRDIDRANGMSKLDADAWFLIRAKAIHERWDELFGVLRGLGYVDGRGHWWEADHVVAVVEGGGQCGIDNLQTLCLRCHKAKTRAMHRARAKGRRRQAALPGAE